MPITMPSADLHDSYMELYSLLDEGLQSASEGTVRPAKEFINEFRRYIEGSKSNAAAVNGKENTGEKR